jgi:hypothetical protein
LTGQFSRGLFVDTGAIGMRCARKAPDAFYVVRAAANIRFGIQRDPMHPHLCARD